MEIFLHILCQATLHPPGTCSTVPGTIVQCQQTVSGVFITACTTTENVTCHFATSVSKYEGVSRAGQMLAANQKNINQGLQCNREENTNGARKTKQSRDQMLAGSH